MESLQSIYLEELLSATQTELKVLVSQFKFKNVFCKIPGHISIIQHDIITPPVVIMWQRPYRILEARRLVISEEIQKMLQLGVIALSCSPWSTPAGMIPKPDGILCFCNNFRKLNKTSNFDGYSMSRVDELLNRLGGAQFISTLDLTKRYWQVRLMPAAKEKTAFSTPGSHWQYQVLPFGLHGALATFQHMMDVLLQPHQDYAAYLGRPSYTYAGAAGAVLGWTHS